MKIKWHWGSKLLVAMILFMLLIITLVYMSMRQTFHLVENDYYPKALVYQDRIDKTQNAIKLDEKVLIENIGEEVVMTFQPAFHSLEINGTIEFYRPSDRSMDIRLPIQTDSAGRQRCDIRSMQKGKYLVKLDYEVEGKGYYQEETIYLDRQ